VCVYDEFNKLVCLLQVTHYRFSVAWTRILPDGTTSNINAAGEQYCVINFHS